MASTIRALAALLLSTLIYYAPAIYRKIVNSLKLRSIPTVGCSGLLTSYIGAYRFQKDARSMVQEGYKRYRGSLFKVPTMRSWIVVVSGPDKLNDIRRASDDTLSFSKELDIGARLGSDVYDNRVHIDVVRSPLTRNIGFRYPDVRDEIIAAFDDYIPVKGDEWVKVRAFSTIVDVVCRVGNRMLVGLPLCRNPDYLELCKGFPDDIFRSSEALKHFPLLIQPIAARFTGVYRAIERGMRHVEPLVKERLEQEELHGKEWPGRPSDILTWLLDVSKGKQQSLRDITTSILLVNLAAVDTTTRTLASLLFDLATYPEYVKPLREEIENITQEGWSSKAMEKMVKLDSFVKESMRLASLNIFGISRKVVKDFTFSDGTTIPAGNTIAVPITRMHTDPDVYPDADIFDGFRFEKMRQKEGENSKHRLATLELDYHLFGQGRHSCPGRIYAANSLKTLLAHVIVNYDVKFANDSGCPALLWSGDCANHDRTAELLFRKRV